MDQDGTWYGGRPRSRRLCVRWEPNYPQNRGHTHHHPGLAHVYCGQTAGWMKTPLGAEVDLDPGQSLLDADPAPPAQKGDKAPNFRPVSIVPKRLDWSRCPWYGGRPRPRPHCARWGPSSPSHKGHSPQNFWPMSIVAKRSPISATAEHFSFSL